MNAQNNTQLLTNARVVLADDVIENGWVSVSDGAEG